METVAELIEALQRFPADQLVYFERPGSIYEPYPALLVADEVKDGGENDVVLRLRYP